MNNIEQVDQLIDIQFSDKFITLSFDKKKIALIKKDYSDEFIRAVYCLKK